MNEMKNHDIESIAFQIISYVGSAKSLALETLYAAKEGDFKLAEEKLEESRIKFVEGHRVHTTLIQCEAAGEKLDFSLLLMHAEDQLMNAETVRELVKEMIELYRRIDS